MNTKTIPLLSISRRRFIAGAAGIVVSGLAAASPLSLLSTLNQGSVDLPSPSPKRLHLDLPEAKRIASQFVAENNESIVDWSEEYPDHLDLADYASASLDALDHLASINAGTIGLGFEWLSPDMASRLARWKCFSMDFDNLDKLTPELARFNNTQKSGLYFTNLKRIDIEAAGYLVDDNGLSQLAIELPEALSLPLANVLSRHPHELFLNVSSLDRRAAKALSRHRGYSLIVRSKLPFPEDSLRAFSGNAMKRLTTERLTTDSAEYKLCQSKYEYRLNWEATSIAEWRTLSHENEA